MASGVKHNAIRCAPSRFRFASSRWRAFALYEQKPAVCGMQAFQAINFLFLHSSLQYQNSTTRQKNKLANAHFTRLCELLKCHCVTLFDTFFVNPFDILVSSQNRSQNRAATCATHTVCPKMKISRLQNHLPELFFLIFFLSFFLLLSDIFATFFAIFIFLFKSLNRLFSRLPGYSKAIYC